MVNRIVKLSILCLISGSLMAMLPGKPGSKELVPSGTFDPMSMRGMGELSDDAPACPSMWPRVLELTAGAAAVGTVFWGVGKFIKRRHEKYEQAELRDALAWAEGRHEAMEHCRKPRGKRGGLEPLSFATFAALLRNKSDTAVCTPLELNEALVTLLYNFQYIQTPRLGEGQSRVTQQTIRNFVWHTTSYPNSCLGDDAESKRACALFEELRKANSNAFGHGGCFAKNRRDLLCSILEWAQNVEMSDVAGRNGMKQWFKLLNDYYRKDYYSARWA